MLVAGIKPVCKPIYVSSPCWCNAWTTLALLRQRISFCSWWLWYNQPSSQLLPQMFPKYCGCSRPVVGGRGEITGDPGRTQTLPGGLMLETCWWPRLLGSKEGCKERSPTARWCHPGTPNGFISIGTTSQGTTDLSCPLPHCFQAFEGFDAKAAFLTETTALWQQRSQFSAKNVALGRKCSHVSNPSIPT